MKRFGDYISRFGERFVKSESLEHGNFAAFCIAFLIAAILVGSWTPKMRFLKHEIADVSQMTLQPSDSVKTSAAPTSTVIEHDQAHGVATPTVTEFVRRPDVTTRHADAISSSTVWLDVIIALLVAAAALQIAWMIRQEKRMDQQARVIGDLREAVEMQALANLAQREHLEKKEPVQVSFPTGGSSAPELTVRRVGLNTIKVGEKIKVKMLLANPGTSKITIKKGKAAIIFSSDKALSSRAADDSGAPVAPNVEFDAGGKNSLIVTSGLVLEEAQFQALSGGDRTAGTLYFYGHLVFEDEQKQHRTLRFCRRFDPVSKRFKVVQDPSPEKT